MKRALILAGVLVCLAVGAFTVSFWHAVSPTHGPRISDHAHGKALVVVDLQEDYTGTDAKQPYPVSTVSVANRLILGAQHGGWPVVFVKTEAVDWFDRILTGSAVLAGTSGAELDGRLERPADSIEIVKSRSDAFSNLELARQLKQREIGHLFIIGLDAARCVKSTLLGALNRGYAVTAVKGGIATRLGTPMEELLRGYQAKGATVKTVEEAGDELSRK